MKQARALALLCVMCLCAICLAPPTARAQSGARMTVLLDTLAIAELVQIMRVEGQAYADELNSDMLNGQGGGFWEQQIKRIYDVERMHETVRQGLEQTLSDAEVEGIIAFFQSQAGTRIVQLENAARAAMSDNAVEDIARETYRDLMDSDHARLVVISEFVDVNDLIERNVSGALTSNYQFYRGLVDGDAFEMSDDEITAEVWGQESEIRKDTSEWLFGFLIMAYQPLSDEDLNAYLTFSRTDVGKALNTALFAGFDRLYVDISYGLGRAVALELAGSDL
jgi:hypothetical protein